MLIRADDRYSLEETLDDWFSLKRPEDTLWSQVEGSAEEWLQVLEALADCSIICGRCRIRFRRLAVEWMSKAELYDFWSPRNATSEECHVLMMIGEANEFVDRELPRVRQHIAGQLAEAFKDWPSEACDKEIEDEEMKMRLVNLTPHPINLMLDDGTEAVLPSSGLCRIEQKSGERLKEFDKFDVPIFGAPADGDIIGLPEPQPGVFYIVSMIAARAIKWRDDILYPGTGPADEPVRDDKGNIKAVTRLIKPQMQEG